MLSTTIRTTLQSNRNKKKEADVDTTTAEDSNSHEDPWDAFSADMAQVRDIMTTPEPLETETLKGMFPTLKKGLHAIIKEEEKRNER